MLTDLIKCLPDCIWILFESKWLPLWVKVASSLSSSVMRWRLNFLFSPFLFSSSAVFSISFLFSFSACLLVLFASLQSRSPASFFLTACKVWCRFISHAFYALRISPRMRLGPFTNRINTLHHFQANIAISLCPPKHPSVILAKCIGGDV